jgi:hypothetical protein
MPAGFGFKLHISEVVDGEFHNFSVPLEMPHNA